MNITELRDKIESLKPLPDSANHSGWLAHRASLRDNILNDNPEKFLSWPVIKATMFVGDFEPVRLQLDWLLDNKYPHHLYWQRVLLENHTGKPETFSHKICRKTSGNLINQAYYLKRWENASNRDIHTLNSIVEFGGGYGAMALMCSRFGFTGQYTIVDLPEYLLLQEYYLSNVLGDISDIHFVNTFADYDIYTDLIISICSLSEVDETAKNRFFEQVRFNHHLVVFQPDWNSWNNRKYFTDRFGEDPAINPYYVNHQYLAK